MKKYTKYMLLLLALLILPIGVFANEIGDVVKTGAVVECERETLYFILEDKYGNKLENKNVILESFNKDYTQNVEYVSNGVYKVDRREIVVNYLKPNNYAPTTLLLIKYNNKYIGALNYDGMYKYSKDTDYSSFDNFLTTAYETLGLVRGNELSDTDIEKLDSKYTFKNSSGEYVNPKDYVLCDDTLNDTLYDKSKLPIVVYEPNIVENKNHTSKVYIKSSELVDISDDTEELESPELKDLQIKFNLKFSDVNDYAKYKLIIKNESETEYKINHDEFNVSDYISYTFDIDDENTYVLSPNSEKVLYVTVKYNKEVPEEKLTNGVFTEDNDMTINFKTKEEIAENPKTGIKNIILLVVILSIVGIITYISIKNNSKFKYMNLLLIGLIIIPFTVKAIEGLKIDIVTHIEIDTTKEFCYITKICNSSESALSSKEVASNKKSVKAAFMVEDPCNYVETYYKYHDGMTWEEYINSDYNTNKNYNGKITEIININNYQYYFGYVKYVNKQNLYYPGATTDRLYYSRFPNYFTSSLTNNGSFIGYSSDEILNLKIKDKSFGCYDTKPYKW